MLFSLRWVLQITSGGALLVELYIPFFVFLIYFRFCCVERSAMSLSCFGTTMRPRVLKEWHVSLGLFRPPR